MNAEIARTAKPAGETDGPDALALLRCLGRSYFVGAGFNTRGMQSVGLVYAMEPGLRAIHKDRRALQAARRRYLKHYNSHPFWAPLLVGMYLFLEREIARKALGPETLESIRQTVTYTLSAIGDSLFGGGLLVMWSLGTACLLVAGKATVAVIVGGVLWGGLQVFKAVTLYYGYREGFGFLRRLRAVNPMGWGRWVKNVNAALTALFWYLVWPHPVAWPQWLAACAGLGFAAMLVVKARIAREFLLLMIVALVAVLPRLGDLARSGW